MCFIILNDLYTAHHNSLGICHQLKICHLYGTFNFSTQCTCSCMGTGSLFVYSFRCIRGKEKRICGSVNLMSAFMKWSQIEKVGIFSGLILIEGHQGHGLNAPRPQNHCLALGILVPFLFVLNTQKRTCPRENGLALKVMILASASFHHILQANWNRKMTIYTHFTNIDWNIASSEKYANTSLNLNRLERIEKQKQERQKYLVMFTFIRNIPQNGIEWDVWPNMFKLRLLFIPTKHNTSIHTKFSFCYIFFPQNIAWFFKMFIVTVHTQTVQTWLQCHIYTPAYT